MPLHMLTGEYLELADRFGPQTNQWMEIKPVTFEAPNADSARQIGEEFIKSHKEWRNLRNFRLWQLIEELKTT